MKENQRQARVNRKQEKLGQTNYYVSSSQTSSRVPVCSFLQSDFSANLLSLSEPQFPRVTKGKGSRKKYTEGKTEIHLLSQSVPEVLWLEFNSANKEALEITELYNVRCCYYNLLT